MSETKLTKLTPEQAFEHLKAVFPSIASIELMGETLVVRRPSNCSDFVFSFDAANIAWGETTFYKPERWRPATIDDVVRRLKGSNVTARVRGDVGMLIGASKPQSILVFGVYLQSADVTVWENADIVEVLDD